MKKLAYLFIALLSGSAIQAYVTRKTITQVYNAPTYRLPYPNATTDEERAANALYDKNYWALQNNAASGSKTSAAIAGTTIGLTAAAVAGGSLAALYLASLNLSPDAIASIQKLKCFYAIQDPKTKKITIKPLEKLAHQKYTDNIIQDKLVIPGVQDEQWSFAAYEGKWNLSKDKFERVHFANQGGVNTSSWKMFSNDGSPRQYHEYAPSLDEQQSSLDGSTATSNQETTTIVLKLEPSKRIKQSAGALKKFFSGSGFSKNQKKNSTFYLNISGNNMRNMKTYFVWYENGKKMPNNDQDSGLFFITPFIEGKALVFSATGNIDRIQAEIDERGNSKR